MNYKQQQAQQMHQGSAPVLITPHKTLSPPCTSPFDSIMDDPLFKEYYWDLMIPYRLATLSERKLVLLGSKSRTSSSSTASTSSPLRRYSLISTVSRLAADKYHDRMLKFMMLKMKRDAELAEQQQQQQQLLSTQEQQLLTPPSSPPNYLTYSSQPASLPSSSSSSSQSYYYYSQQQQQQDQYHQYQYWQQQQTTCS